MSEVELVQKVTTQIKEEYVEIMFASVLNNNAIEALSPQLGVALVNHVKSRFIMEKAVNQVLADISDHINEYKCQLKKKYPIRSNISEWLVETVDKEIVNIKEYLLDLFFNLLKHAYF